MAVDRVPLVERARGRWRSLLPALGVDARFLRIQHGPCPACGGTDRFRFTDRDGSGSFICCPDGRGCGNGASGVDLVMRVNGWSFKQAAEEIEALLPGTAFQPPKPDRSEEDKRRALNLLWTASRPVTRDDAAGCWLRNRVGLASYPECLRTSTRTLFLHDDASRSWHPAMIAMLTAPDGAASNLHRTFLTPDGQKAPVPPKQVRRVMPGRIAKGSAIRLMPHDGTLGIAESIENAFSAASLFTVPCWAAGNATLLAQFEPADDVRELIVFGDNDPAFGGAKASYDLAHRLAVKGRTVSVKIPDRIGADWNDVLRETA